MKTKEWLQRHELLGDDDRMSDGLSDMYRGWEPSPKEAKERAEQEAADQAEERRVAREEASIARLRKSVDDGICHQLDYRVPPYLFADERSQRRVEEEARQERPLDDYGTWTDQNEQLFR